MRIAVGGIMHETSTFLPVPTDLKQFENGFGMHRGPEMLEAFRGANICCAGFIDAAKAAGYTPVPLLWTFAYPSGLIIRSTYETLKNEFLERLAAADAEERLDGVLLDLHGAMVVEGIDDGDGDMAAAVRKAIGPDRPLIVTYDLHGNHTELRMDSANASLGYDTYPHVDMAERGVEAGMMIARAVRKEIRPVTGLVRLPMFWSAQRQATSHLPMKEVIDRVHEAERKPGILAASVSTAFPWADVPNIGASVFVVADGDKKLAQSTAQEIADWIWERRERWYSPPMETRDAIEAGQKAGKYPILLGDYNDNTGGGAPGDSTAVLQTFVDLGLEDALVLYIADPEAAEAAHRAGKGARLHLAIGGKSHPDQGPPVPLDVEVVALSDGSVPYDGPMHKGLSSNLGPSAWLRAGGISILVVSGRQQPLDQAFPRSLGIDCSKMKYISLKSAVHFRSGYEKIAGSIYLVDAPALHTHQFNTMPFKRRPKMFPFELK